MSWDQAGVVRYKTLRRQLAPDVPVGDQQRRHPKRPYAVQMWYRGWRRGATPHWWTLGRYATLRAAEQAFEQHTRQYWPGPRGEYRLVVEVRE